MRLSWFIANRIGSRGEKGLSSLGNVIAVLSVALSIMVIIISISVSRGFRSQMMEKMAAFAGDVNVSVLLPSGGSDYINADEYSLPPLSAREEILSIPYVSEVLGVSYRPGMIKTEEDIQGVMLKGVDTLFAEDGCYVSGKLGDLLGFNVGDKATFYFVGQNVKVRRLKILGLFSSSLENLDKFYVICSKKLVNGLNGWEEDRASAYQIMFTDHSDKDYPSRRVQIGDIVYRSFEGENLPRVSGAYDDMGNLVDWLRLLDMNVLIILVLMIAVSAFNMISCVLIILFENISSIGVLKSLGMKNSGIKKVFLAKSARIVLTGLAIGNVLAIAFCLLQKHFHFIRLNPENYFISYVPIDISWWSILAADVISFIAIMAILLIPCHFISRIQPSKTIRVR
ncbi:MAG: ABC transporter permease [Bacteroidales bacterium]|jgi:lipoprotein-releasing system permease protein|nr:ABC transporter permease [Bacteroidales bacterium]